MASHAGKAVDVAVYGATGFTGRLVAEYLAKTYPSGSSLIWAMAGRSADKLAAVRDKIGAPADIPLIVANSADPASLEAMAAQAKVILTTVGPYQVYGNELVEVCARTGTDYVDLCGEPAWMHDIVRSHQETAAASGARIVLSCGFDSIPSDLGVLFLQQEAQARFGKPFSRIDGRVVRMKGTWSGGTSASFKATMAAAGSNPEIIPILKNAFALTPGFEGPKQPSMSMPREDDAVDGQWVAPFMMAPINTKNVHRSNFLLEHPWGEDFQYSEMMLCGSGEEGEARAQRLAGLGSAMVGDKTPQPGEGPSLEERESGYYNLIFVGRNEAGDSLTAQVQGDRDPGYGSTSKMIAESAVCLVLDRTDTPGGVWTTAPAMGQALIDRLQNNAGLSFALVS